MEKFGGLVSARLVFSIDTLTISAKSHDATILKRPTIELPLTLAACEAKPSIRCVARANTTHVRLEHAPQFEQFRRVA